jgi:hypothetical protein
MPEGGRRKGRRGQCERLPQCRAYELLEDHVHVPRERHCRRLPRDAARASSPPRMSLASSIADRYRPLRRVKIICDTAPRPYEARLTVWSASPASVATESSPRSVAASSGGGRPPQGHWCHRGLRSRSVPKRLRTTMVCLSLCRRASRRAGRAGTTGASSSTTTRYGIWCPHPRSDAARRDPPWSRARSPCRGLAQPHTQS